METKKKSVVVLVVVFIVTILVSALLGAGGLLIFFKYNPEFIKDTVTNITKTEKEVTVTDTGIADAVEKIYDSVVVVQNYKSNRLYATGTGFFYRRNDNKYFILTNQHVISGGDKVSVVLTDGSVLDVKVEGGDKYADIAVLSLETDKDIAIAEIGNNNKVRVGDTVFAIGAPLDSSVYSWSVTRGVLSGKDREVAVSTDSSTISDWIMTVLQTDTAINSGNSGGPLCNSNGQVIGITNMKLVTTGVEGMGFAIPIEEALTYAEQLVESGSISRPQLGVEMANASSYAGYYGYDSDITGVVIANVVKDSAAEKAGLKSGDVITALNDVEIQTVAALRYQLYQNKPGDTISIKYIRDGESHTTKVTLN
ncbi:MAG: trypsin-like peptidase domain-containing protein [Bacilli bacterium]|nr:trypsin-like peptidase domain-containing protein [Bacilli bacterium]